MLSLTHLEKVMKNTKILIWLLAIVGWGSLLVAPAAWAQADGKALFLKKRCQSCHTVAAVQITVDEEDAAELDDDDELQPPDLSAVGLHFERSSLLQFLLKKERREGRLHKKRFVGKKADLEILVDWLMTMTQEPAKPEAEK